MNSSSSGCTINHHSVNDAVLNKPSDKFLCALWRVFIGHDPRHNVQMFRIGDGDLDVLVLDKRELDGFAMWRQWVRFTLRMEMAVEQVYIIPDEPSYRGNHPAIRTTVMDALRFTEL